MQLSRLVALPFIIIGIVALYFAFKAGERDFMPNRDTTLVIAGCVVAFAVIFVFSPQIDWWWYRRNPPGIDGRLRYFLQEKFYPYTQLLPDDRRRFEDRLSLWLIAVDAKLQSSDDEVPEDLKAFIGAHAVMLTLSHADQDFLYPDFERIVLYKHAFPSPRMQYLHSSELDPEDGVLIFDIERMMLGGLQPLQHYNLLWHEWAAAYRLSYPDKPYPALSEDILPALARARGYGLDYIERYVGVQRQHISLWQVATEHYMVVPEQLQRELPEVYAQLEAVYGSAHRQEGVTMML